VLRPTELAVFVGAGLAGAAYVPQIWHLMRRRCSAGLSRVAFAAWLAASLLVTTHAIAIGAAVFIVLGAVQLVATALILILSIKYATSNCDDHVPALLLDVPPGQETGVRPTVAVPPHVGRLHHPRTTSP
jgi:hypothetical protein